MDAHYYYRYLSSFDYTYDVYAEWPLNKDEYTKEIERVSSIFSKSVENETYNYEFIEQRKGEYNCLILYSGDKPFSTVTNSYEYIIFAYNDKTNTVRYIYCSSLENGADQPYYLELDW